MDQNLILACVVSLFLHLQTAKSDEQKPNSGGVSTDQILMFAGYFVIGFLIVCMLLLWLFKKRKSKAHENLQLDAADGKVAAVDEPSFSTVELKTAGAEGVSKTSAGSADQSTAMVSSSLIVLSSPEVNGLNFEDLLKAPAELLGRGNHGSVYKVACAAQGINVAVKRIKDWTISSTEFKQRMTRLNQVKHPYVLPAIAFYCSRQEKLLLYEYQQNGSLFSLIHVHENDERNQQAFHWSSRVSVAATLAHSLAFMHEQLQNDKIPHGNLKSSNILLNNNMEPCISEYGLMLNYVNMNHKQQSKTTLDQTTQSFEDYFKEDTYAFGVILLELLTGRRHEVLSNELDLASWVVAVVREEWTVEVFDKKLIRQGASEERMVNMLQVAIKCVDKSPHARPNMNQVALMISLIKEEEEKSMEVSHDLSFSRSFIDL